MELLNVCAICNNEYREVVYVYSDRVVNRRCGHTACKYTGPIRNPMEGINRPLLGHTAAKRKCSLKRSTAWNFHLYGPDVFCFLSLYIYSI